MHRPFFSPHCFTHSTIPTLRGIVRIATSRGYTAAVCDSRNILSFALKTENSKILHIASAAHRVLHEADPMQKVRITKECFENVQNGNFKIPQNDDLETFVARVLRDFEALRHPARPDRPELVAPKQMPSHQKLNLALPIYILHNCAHIELSAMDMCFHTILLALCREYPVPDVHWSDMYSSALDSEKSEFLEDFVHIAADEARHFAMLSERLGELGYEYGSIPAHNTLWKTALETEHDLRARVCLIQLVNEARGLDSGPRLTEKLTSAADKKSSRLIGIICEEEELHVQLGMKHFTSLCEATGVNPKEMFHHYVRQHYGPLPTPFNDQARRAAGMPDDWYTPLAREVERTVK